MLFSDFYNFYWGSPFPISDVFFFENKHFKKDKGSRFDQGCHVNNNVFITRPFFTCYLHPIFNMFLTDNRDFSVFQILKCLERKNQCGPTSKKFCRELTSVQNAKTVGWKLSITASDNFVELVSKRTSMVLTPVVYAAYLLNPHHTGDKMNPSEVSEAVSYIKDSCESDVLPALMKHMGKIPPYSPHLFGSSFKNVSSDSWWKGGLRMGFDPILVDVACSIVEAVSSSAGLERYFLTMGLTHVRTIEKFSRG